LFQDLAKEQSAKFNQYQDLQRELPLLIRQQIVVIKKPAEIREIQDPLVTASIASDLHDTYWTRLASVPSKYDLPFEPDSETRAPTWQTFQPKMPTAFIDLLAKDKALAKHLLVDGGE